MEPKTNMECCVCGRPATGAHYGVTACGGCGVFYKRAVEQKIKYQCYFGGDCSTEAGIKVKVPCKACRFRKCTALGMKLRGRKSPGARAQLSKEPSPAKNNSDNQVWRCPVKALEIEVLPLLPVLSDNMIVPEDVPQPGTFRFSSEISCSSRLLSDETAISCGYNKQEISATVNAIEAAVQLAFGDQLTSWTAHRKRVEQSGKVVRESETVLDKMVHALNTHNREMVKRIQKFTRALPEVAQMEPAAPSYTRTGWKYFVCWMIHHAPFLNDAEAYFTMGPEQLTYFQRWQDLTSNSEAAVNVFIYSFCAQFREIGLALTEQYLLMAVVLCEPVEENPPDRSHPLQAVHRHYADALLDTIRRRCSDSAQLTVICRKLERFFNVLKMAYCLYQFYYGSSKVCPPNVLPMSGRVPVASY